MGIREYFVRITPDELTFLQAAQDRDQVIQFLSQFNDSFFFWPLSEEEELAAARKLCIEKSWWEMFNAILAMKLDDHHTPTWNMTEAGTPIQDFWIAYSPLRCLYPEELPRFAELLRSIPEASLLARFNVDMQDVAMDEEEHQHYFRGFLACYSTIGRFIDIAIEHNQVLLWYIG